MSGLARATTVARRGLGAVFLALAFLPIYRILGGSAGGSSFREASLLFGELNLELALWGTITIVLAGAVLARLIPADRIRGYAGLVAKAVQTPSRRALGLLAAGLAGGLAFLVWTLLYEGHYTNVDEIASMVHARYLAAGKLAGSLPATPAAWLFPNTLMVEEGWVSQYPPSHLAVMALLVRLGVPGLLGPLCVAATAFLLVLSLPRLLPERPAEARLAGLLFALSPFVVLLGGGALSHLTAGLFLTVALYASLRARDGSVGWAVLAGAAIGLAVMSRPLQGVVLGTLFTLGLWIPARTQLGGTALIRRCFATAMGGIPFALAFGWFNERLFGDPFTLGYSAAYGARHGLGFHMDPWGAPYGAAEALGFTSTDFLEIGIRFLETPIPLTAVVGLYLLSARALPRGAGFLITWATLPLVANAGYWFHTTRMIYEGAPAWLALGVLGTAHLTRRPTQQKATSRFTSLRWQGPDTAVWSATLALVVAGAWGVPRLVESHGWTDETLGRIAPPTFEGTGVGGALVFVHAGWYERMSAVLQGEGGMRSDTIVSVLRRNSTCRVHEYAEARAAAVSRGVGAAVLPAIDLRQEPGTAPGVRQRPVPGMALNVRMVPGERLTPECARHLQADRFGMVSLAPLLLKGELPGLETGDGALYVRDLGPRRNRTVMAAFPERTPYLLASTTTGGAPRLMPYLEGERLIWSPGNDSDFDVSGLVAP